MAPVYVSDEGIVRLAYLDDELMPVKCFDEGLNPLRCPEALDLREGETYVTGWAAAEVLASYLGARYVDERTVRMEPSYDPSRPLSLLSAVRGAVEKGAYEPVVGNTILSVLPGNVLRRKSWGVAVIAKVSDREPTGKAVIEFDQTLRTRSEIISGALEELRRFDYWWQPPWESAFAYGKNIRKLVEVLSERAVGKIPKDLISGERASLEEFLEALVSYASSREFEMPGRSLKKSVVYIDESIYSPRKGYVGIVIVRNSQRRVFARWFFDEKFRIQGFDNVPPEAVSGIDAEIAIGRVPREVQFRIPEPIAAFLVRVALKAPVKLVDYLAMKAHRWYEASA